ncbi:MAG: FxsA family protein [Alkalispirochaeta sp.]
MTPEWLYLFTRRSYLVRLFSVMTGLAILMLADGLFLVRLARRSGVYLALALEGGVTIVAAVILGSTIHTLIKKIRNDARSGSVVPRRYGELAAVVSAAVLLVLPGFVTDVAGFVLFLPPGRYIYSALFIRFNGDAIQGIYEYLKLELFSHDELRESGERSEE